MTVTVRQATADDCVTVLSILDGAALATDADRVRRATDAGDLLVATSLDGERILGALVLDGEEIANVAVRPGRRGQGIGRALVEAAADRRERLWATFDPSVRRFYESLDFAIEEVDEESTYTDRLIGRRE